MATTPEPAESRDGDGDGDGCDLCGLPTPDDPVTVEGVDGEFCCRGCAEVARSFDGERPGAGDGDADDALDADEEVDVPEGAESAFFRVDGMHCSACETFLASRARDVDGVYDASASYPTELANVSYDPERVDADDIARRLSVAGYRARSVEDADGDDDERVGRLLVGGFFGMMVMVWYVLFLYPTYLGLPERFLLFDLTGEAGAYLFANVWVATTVVVGYTGAPLLRGAYVSLRAGEPNMDLLVSLASVTAYVYSTAAILLGRLDVYFDVAVVIVMAVAIGSYYETRIRRRALERLTGLASERLDTARVRRGDGTESVDVADLDADDRVVVEPGETVPVDGVVCEGTAAVDESLVTGESVPVRKSAGDDVLGGTALVDGRLVVEPDAEGRRTLDRLLSMLWDAQSARAGTQRLADRLAGVFVPLVLLLAGGATAWRLLSGTPPVDAMLAGLAVLVVSCPCALGLATPLAHARAIEDGLDAGLVLTDSSAVERADDVDVVVFDKTGTLTTGEMRLAAFEGDDETLRRAAAVERGSSHPLAEAVVAAADDVSDGAEGAAATATDVETHPGRGVSGVVAGDRVTVGSADLFVDADVPDVYADAYERAEADGRLPAYVGWGGEVRGVLVGEDEPREGWEDVVSDLADAGVRVVVLTGDNAAAADRFAAHSGVDEVFAGVPPDGKTETVRRLRREGVVAMVGDGSNDAPALAEADVGIAIGDATALAVDAADVVVVSNDLSGVSRLFELTRSTRRRVRENLGWAFCYNAVALPLALAGVLNPLFAAFAMAASSLLVVGNSVRGLLGRESENESE